MGSLVNDGLNYTLIIKLLVLKYLTSASSIKVMPPESSQGQISNFIMVESMDDLKASIVEAKKELVVAEQVVKAKRMRVEVLQKQLQSQLTRAVGGLKEAKPDTENNPSAPVDEETRRANVRRRWRVLGLKVKFGLAANLMAVKKRNLNDLNSFMDRDTEEATKEDQLDLEGRCARKKLDKRHFRRGGVCVGSTQGRDAF